jgi:hypothetical protein
MILTISRRIFMLASLTFGVLGISMVVVAWDNGQPEWLVRAFVISIFVILPSFAVSLATKYLTNKQHA